MSPISVWWHTSKVAAKAALLRCPNFVVNVRLSVRLSRLNRSNLQQPTAENLPTSSCPTRIRSAWIPSSFPPVRTAAVSSLYPARFHPARKALTALVSHRFDAIRLLWNLVQSFPFRFTPRWQATQQDRSDCSVIPLLIDPIKHQNWLGVFYVEIHVFGGTILNEFVGGQRSTFWKHSCDKFLVLFCYYWLKKKKTMNTLVLKL